MLTNLLRGAAQFDALPALLAALQATVTSWQETYTTGIGQTPALTPFATFWQERLTKTGKILAQIKQQIEAAA
jgi:hypothetical protein